MADRFSIVTRPNTAKTWELRDEAGTLLATGRDVTEVAAATSDSRRVALSLVGAAWTEPPDDETVLPPTGEERLAMLRACVRMLEQPGGETPKRTYGDEVRDVLRRLAADLATQPR